MQQGTTKGHAAWKPNDESLIVLQRSKLKETRNYGVPPPWFVSSRTTPPHHNPGLRVFRCVKAGTGAGERKDFLYHKPIKTYKSVSICASDFK